MPEDSKQLKSCKNFPVITNRKLQTDMEEYRQKTEYRIRTTNIANFAFAINCNKCFFMMQ